MTQLDAGICNIQLDGNQLPSIWFARLKAVRVETSLEVPSMFSMVFASQGFDDAWNEKMVDTFKPGIKVQIDLGINKAIPVIAGIITALDFDVREQAVFTVTGFDNLYKLKLGKATRPFLNTNESKMLQAVTDNAQLKIDIQSAPEFVYDYVLQNNQSDYDFLMARAARLNYELYATPQSLIYRPCGQGKGATTTLNYLQDFKHLNLRARLPVTGAKIVGIGWDNQNNEAITVEVDKGLQNEKMGGQFSGYSIDSLVADSSTTLECPDIQSSDMLKSVCEAYFQRQLNNFVRASLPLNSGHPQLNAGENITLSGLNQGANGSYYIIASHHDYSVEQGYFTSLELRRSGL